MKRILLLGAAWITGAIVLLVLGGYGWYRTLGIDAIPKPNKLVTVADLEYLQHPVSERRGRILAVVSSAARMPDGKKKAGYELTELSRAYYVFTTNGYEVDFASPAGGAPPMVQDDMGEYDYAFLNDSAAQERLKQSLRLADIDPARYSAVYFVGGKGAMVDFPGNPEVQRIIRSVAARGVVGAVCHGPAALMGVTGDDGKPFIAGKRITAVSNAEELFLREDARTIFAFLLEDRAIQSGARFSQAPLFLDHSVTDGRLVTGQNPWSTWSTAEGMVQALGHTPLPRAATAEEHSVRLLATYYRDGFDAARKQKAATPRFDKMLLLMHAVVAGMEWRLGDAFQLQRLATS